MIVFEGWRTIEGCHFSHTEEFGLRKKIIGPFLNWLFFKVLCRKKANWQLIRDDMVLDNKLLDKILTKGIYPERSQRSRTQKKAWKSRFDTYQRVEEKPRH